MPLAGFELVLETKASDPTASLHLSSAKITDKHSNA